MNSEQASITEKSKTLSEALESEFVLVHLNTKKSSDLKLPQNLLQSPTVTLKLSYYFEGQLQLFETFIEANLLFGETYFTCTIPLECIWGITSEQGQNKIWAEDIPAELLQSNQQNDTENKSKSTGKTKLAPESDPKSNTQATKGKKTKKSPGSHLKRIK